MQAFSRILTPQLWALCIIFGGLSSAFAESKTISATVLYVIDGDTFRALVEKPSGGVFETSVRVAHIDTPETKYGYECEAERRAGYVATHFAKELLPRNTNIVLAGMRPGKYEGRVIAEVLLPNGKDYGQIMLQSGHAIPYEGGWKRKIWCKG